MRVERRIDSDHTPLELKLSKISKEDIMESREIEIIDWTTKGVEEYREKIKE